MKKIWIIAGYTPENEIDKVVFAYVKTIENNSNALVYIVPCSSKNTDVYIQELDGFLVPGGHSDVDPQLYGEVNQASNNVDIKNDKLIIEVIHKIIKSWKPLLWICKGMQLINVALGGSLIQNIPDTQYSFDVIHDVQIDQKSRLFQLYGKKTMLVNSLHHQAIKQIGEWLNIVAHNKEWVIEAIESNDGKVLGVQWHPEYLKEHECLFSEFYA